jgi:hypothetical protein
MINKVKLCFLDAVDVARSLCECASRLIKNLPVPLGSVDCFLSSLLVEATDVLTDDVEE